jgi:hypothetical protein
MATYYKILGQAKSTTALASKLYYADPAASTGVPAATSVQAIVSTITVCNITSSTQTYNINIYKSDSVVAAPDTFTSVAPDNAIIYNGFINANETITLTLGITLDTYDRISVNASGASFGQYVNFFAFGSEIRQ